jgi:hypothetical protein
MPSRRGHAAHEDEGSSRVQTTVVAAVLAASGFTFWRYLVAYPPVWPHLALDSRLGFDVDKAAGLAGALLFIGALNLAAWQLGAWARQGLGDTERGRLAGLAQLALGLMIIPYLVLALAACRLLHPFALAALLAVPCVLALPRLVRGLRARARRPRDSPRARFARPEIGLWLALGLFLAAGPLLSALGPQLGWDAEVYHLALPERYLFHGGIYVTPFSLYSAFPGHMEMFYLLALGLSGEVAAKLVHFEFGVLLFALVYVVASRESRRCAVLALLFLASEPLLYTEMSWAYNDLVAPFYALFAFVGLRSWSESGERTPLLRAGLFAGACLATRYLGGAVLVSLCAAMWLVPVRVPSTSRVRASFALAGLAGLALLPWLARNWIFTGNPAAPTLQGLFYSEGNEFFSPLAILQTYAFHDAIGMGRDAWALLKLPWNLTVGSIPGSYRDSFGFQLSPLHAIGFVSALALALYRRRRDIARALVMVVVFALLWFPFFQEVRFLLPLAGILALLGGWAFDELLPRRPGLASVLWVFPFLGAGLAGSAQLAELGTRYTLALGSAPRAAEQKRYAGPAGAAALRATLASHSDAKVFLVAESRSYLFRGLDYIPYQPLEAPPTLEWLRAQPDVGALHCGLQDMGVTHVFANFNNIAGPVRPRAIPDYAAGDYAADMQRIKDLMDQRGRAIYKRGGIGVVRLSRAEGCESEE